MDTKTADQPADRDPNRQKYRQTDRQTDREACRWEEIERQTHHTDKTTADKPTDRQINNAKNRFEYLSMRTFVTNRVALIFRVRSAQKLALSDGVLLKRLCLLVLLYSSYLTVWTVMQPPSTETAMTSNDLKYERCVENWFDLTIIFGKSQNISRRLNVTFKFSFCLWDVSNNVNFVFS